jgi:hypothetical protein
MKVMQTPNVVMRIDCGREMVWKRIRVNALDTVKWLLTKEILTVKFSTRTISAREWASRETRQQE